MTTALMTIPEFCHAANIGRTNAYKLINVGDIKAVKVGKKTLIPRTALESWIASLEPYKA